MAWGEWPGRRWDHEGCAAEDLAGEPVHADFDLQVAGFAGTGVCRREYDLAVGLGGFEDHVGGTPADLLEAERLPGDGARAPLQQVAVPAADDLGLDLRRRRGEGGCGPVDRWRARQGRQCPGTWFGLAEQHVGAVLGGVGDPAVAAGADGALFCTCTGDDLPVGRGQRVGGVAAYAAGADQGLALSGGHGEADRSAGHG